MINNNILFNSNRFRILISSFVFSYILFSLLLYFIHPQRVPLGEHIFIQLTLLIFFCSFLNYSIKVSINAILLVIMIYQLFFTFFLYNYFLNIIGNSFGYDPIDAIYYLDLAKYSVNHTLKQLLVYIRWKNTEISDYGFPVIRFFIFKLAGSVDIGILFMCIVNTISMTIGSYFLYKLALFFLDFTSAKIVGLLWGLNSCSIWINTSGLKESIFTTLIIISMLQLYRFFYQKKTLLNIILLLIFVLTTLFFRIWITYFFIILILLKPLYTGKLRILAPLAVIFLTIITAFATYLLTTQDLFLTHLLLKQENRSDKSLMNLLINLLTGFIGPLPNFLNPPVTTSKSVLFHSVYSAFKVFFSLFAIFGGWYILKNKIIKLYPLFFYVFFNILLVIGTVRSLEYRFSYTMIPFYFILIVYGFNHFKFKYKKIYSIAYFIMASISVIGYNFR
jgi:hypothetical protein